MCQAGGECLSPSSAPPSLIDYILSVLECLCVLNSTRPRKLALKCLRYVSFRCHRTKDPWLNPTFFSHRILSRTFGHRSASYRRLSKSICMLSLLDPLVLRSYTGRGSSPPTSAPHRLPPRVDHALDFEARLDVPQRCRSEPGSSFPVWSILRARLQCSRSRLG